MFGLDGRQNQVDTPASGLLLAIPCWAESLTGGQSLLLCHLYFQSGCSWEIRSRKIRDVRGHSLLVHYAGNWDPGRPEWQPEVRVCVFNGSRIARKDFSGSTPSVSYYFSDRLHRNAYILEVVVSSRTRSAAIFAGFLQISRIRLWESG